MRKEAVKFKWVHKTKWKTLKHLSNSFTDMDEAIRFIRHNKTELCRDFQRLLVSWRTLKKHLNGGLV